MGSPKKIPDLPDEDRARTRKTPLVMLCMSGYLIFSTIQACFGFLNEGSDAPANN